VRPSYACSSIGRDVNLNGIIPELPFPQVDLFRNPFIYW